MAEKQKFENDVAVQKAMRHFYSTELAKIVLYDPETRDVFKRNMVEGCWRVIQDCLDDPGFRGTPEEIFRRFVEEYEKHLGEEGER